MTLVTIKNQKTGETKQVDQTQLPQYGIKSSVTQPISPTTSKNPTTPSASPPTDGTLPMIGGIAGNIIGAGGAILAGQPELAYPAGIAVGAVGQSLGEFGQQLINGKPIDIGNIAKQGVIGGAYAAIPGGEEVGVGAKIAQRALTGGIVSGGTQAVREVGTPGTLQEKGKRVGEQTALGSFTFPLIGAGTDAFAGAAKFLGEKLPHDLITNITKAPQEVANWLHNKVQQALVGHDNLDYAISNGIIPKSSGITTDVINGSIQRAKAKATQVEGDLQNALTKSGITINFKESGLGKLMNSIYDALPHNYTKAKSLFTSLTQIAAGDAEKLGHNISGVLGGAGDTPISLSAVNEMKRVIGELYDNPATRELYHNFKTLIEKASGLPEEIRALNEEAGKLINIKANLSEMKGQKVIPDQLTPDYINKAVQEAAQGKFGSLNTLVNMISMAGLAGSLTLMHTFGTGVGIGGMGLTFGMRSGIRDAINDYFTSPENRAKVAENLINMYQKSGDIATKTRLGSIIRALGIRIPAIAGSPSNQVVTPAGLKGPTQ